MKPQTLGYQTITPAIAKSLVDSAGERQRASSKAHVAVLRDRILGGQWDRDAGTMTIDAAGRLTDGLHRCRAIVAAGIPVDVRVFEAEWSTFRDDVRRRTVAERNGISKRMAAVTRLCGRMTGITDPDQALALFSENVTCSRVLSVPETKPFGCAAALVGGVLAETRERGAGANCLMRLAQGMPSSVQESRLTRLALSGKILTTGCFQTELSRLIFNAALNARADNAEIKEICMAMAK